MTIDTVEPGGPADKAGMKAGDVDHRVRRRAGPQRPAVLRLVQETTPGRSVPVVLSRAGQRVTVNVTPERSSFGDDFGLRYLDGPRRGSRSRRPRLRPRAAGGAARARVPPAMPFELFGRAGNTGRLGITIEELDTQLAEYFGVKEGVLVKSVARRLRRARRPASRRAT